MKVCHLGKHYPPAVGGIENHVRTLARAQAERGADVRVVCINHRNGPTLVEKDGTVTVVSCRRTATVAKLDLCPGLLAELSALDADILHVHVPNPLMILATLLARPRQKIVVTYHSDHVRQVIRSMLFRPIESRFYSRVPAVLATSAAYAESSPLLRALGSRVKIVPLGIELDPFLDPSEDDRAEAQRVRNAHPGPLWLACGRLVYYKGLVNALHALVRVEGTLVIIGEGPERAALEAQARKLGVGKRVSFVPHVPSLVPYYLAAHAFWFPSNARSEAFGIVQLEAMATGCPVINARIPGSGVPWVSRHEESGLTVAPDDPAALAAAARRILSEPGLRARLGASGRQRARLEFDKDVMADRTLAIYREILAGEPAHAR
jgi:glycosyltransferase involved in cell wall biosynthesis